MPSISTITERDWRQYEYLIDCTITIPDVGSYTLNQLQIEGIYLEKDFDNDHLPVLLLDLSISKLMELRIMKHAEDTTFALTITSYIRDPENPDMIMDKVKIISGEFHTIIPDVTPDTERQLRKILRENNDSDDNEFALEDTLNKVTYILIKSDAAKASRTIVNNVLTNVNLTTAYAYILTAAGIKNVLMSNFDNTDVIPEMLLLPIPALNELIYLENYYGLHREGTQIFMDFDTTYINRMNGQCTVWKRNEVKNVTFFIGNMMNAQNIVCGSFVSGDTTFVNVDKDSYRLGDDSSSADQLIGQNITLVNEDTTEVTNVNAGGEFTTVKTTFGHNKYINEQLVFRKNENKRIIHIMCTYINISCLTPNKQYRFITDDSEIVEDLGGTYRMSSWNTTFVREGNHFITATVATLKRVSST